MNTESRSQYNFVTQKGFGFFETNGGVIEVTGKEAVMFLNGMISNDVAKLPDNSWMLAALPNAQGRLLAFVKVIRFGERFFFITDEQTHDKVMQNLTRFVLAGDFFVTDRSPDLCVVSINGQNILGISMELPKEDQDVPEFTFQDGRVFAFRDLRRVKNGFMFVVSKNIANSFNGKLSEFGGVSLSEETRDVLRIENGIPLYGIDVDETTVVLESGLDEAVSFTKGCYIGQEIIARIHFRGHVAKKLTGLVFESVENENWNRWLNEGGHEPLAAIPTFALNGSNADLASTEGKNAGRITSVTFSPRLRKFVALAFVRYEFLQEGTELRIGQNSVKVMTLPFIK